MWAAKAYWSNSEWRIDSCSIRIIPSMTIASGFTHNNLTFIGGQEGLFVHNHNIKKSFDQPFKTLIRTVTLGYDSIIYKGAEGFDNLVVNNNLLQLVTPISYKYNYIDFAFSSPYFESESQTLYQSYLEGYDKSWSDWDEKYTILLAVLSQCQGKN